MYLLHIFVVPLIDSLTHSFGELSGRQIAQNGTGEISPVRIPIHVITFQVSRVLSDC